MLQEMTDSSNGAEPDLPKTILSAIRKFVNNRRTNHLGKARTPVMVCPGMICHASNFIKYLDENRNTGDEFYNLFYTEYPNYEEELIWSLKNVHVSS